MCSHAYDMARMAGVGPKWMWLSTLENVGPKEVPVSTLRPHRQPATTAVRKAVRRMNCSTDGGGRGGEGDGLPPFASSLRSDALLGTTRSSRRQRRSIRATNSASYATHTPSTVIPVSLHSIAAMPDAAASSCRSQLVPCGRAPRANSRMDAQKRMEDVTSARPTTPVTASVWIGCAAKSIDAAIAVVELPEKARITKAAR
mmetsp:Transcript_14870/g.47381  ORF Transcript_14870/g.47381 Transcript_14870/m.47381 type:complete len:201 (-) Transcript_14870:304-906(-)